MLNELKDYIELCNKVKSQPIGSQLGLLRYLCRTDLFFLLWFGCSRSDIGKPWLLERCREVQESPNGHLDLWARGHYKDLDCEVPVLTVNRGWIKHGPIGS
jgi:hypothetical protein